ncbi:2OG-Fe(II) oxygenase superfamily protein [Colletotrichum graminicola]|uniref:2OG-Fe(II) oxygenase superfamily protein n=1 Tax=Colletotrichum graminicola (strain M1.001 / M2 / FGSC 10212) TaxID=645133 RepID=E3Q2A9_COLGM|nr:2OG-Fe(II) oxygenase superfamily protein [Colletotrichum graminicola M1.001]EFQ25210.1 2OG-Fe(II) oxygenase superfamily protein [Colletotrichum graminicola M1.001]WDK15164.1 2OG-Fe(II) oxygenase superfamily protein [Colletotrichum graminicola]
MAPGSGSFTAIPTIDLSLADDPASEAGLLEQLRHALVHVGFLYVVNHGVRKATVSAVVEALPRLFALPAAAKQEIALENSPHFLGYSGDGAETTAGAVDRREQVEFATQLTDQWRPGLPLRERLRGPNQWPSAYPNLRPIVEAYISEMTLLGERFLRLVAKALSLPPETFLPFLSDQHRLKLVRYPALPPDLDTASGGSQGVGPHKDSSGWWTFLLQASPPHVGGLQALNRDGGWVDVPALPGSFVVNIGQAFEVVTSGVCRATTHRVLSGPLERFSVPFFQGVRRDLTKDEAAGSFWGHSSRPEIRELAAAAAAESAEGRGVDSAFLQGKYDTWGESQLRTNIRSHRDVGKKFYPEVFDQYVNDDQ